jgi:hypothetical protein
MSKSPTSAFGHFHVFHGVDNAPFTTQLLLSFQMHCIFLDDALQYFAALAVVFVMGMLRYICSASLSQHFITHTFAVIFRCELLVPASFMPGSHLLSDEQTTSHQRKLLG